MELKHLIGDWSQLEYLRWRSGEEADVATISTLPVLSVSSRPKAPVWYVEVSFEQNEIEEAKRGKQLAFARQATKLLLVGAHIDK